MKKIFASEGALWNWVVVSSADPNAVALSVKGLTSLAVVQTVFSLLPSLGIHPSFDLASVSDALYTVVYSGLTIVSGLASIMGLGRKIWLYFYPAAPATPAV